MKKIYPVIVLIIICHLPAYSCNSTITIAATSPASDTVCGGSKIQYAAVIQSNGGTGNTYQWKVNGISVPGATTAAYSYPPAAGDNITCVLTNTCGTAISNNLYPIVNEVINEKSAQFFCPGYNTTLINLFGANWTNNNAIIGLGASGTGSVPAFTAVNTGSTALTAIITATLTCNTTTDTTVFPIIINPEATVTGVSDQSVCAGNSTTAIDLTGPVPFTVFNWTGSNAIVGLAASGTDSIPSFTGINTGNTPVIDTITVTPFTSGFAYMTDAINGYAYAVSRATNSLVASITGLGGFFNGSTGITVSSDGQWVYIANNGENTVSVVSTASNTVTNTINVGNEPWGIVISPDGKTVYCTNSGDGTISVINTATNTVSTTINLPGGPASNPEGVAIGPEGNRLFVSCSTDTGKVYYISTATNAIVDSYAVGSNPSGIIVSPDAESIYVANNTSRNISTITYRTGRVTSSAVFTNNIQGQVENNGLALSPDGLTLYVSSFWDGTVVYYNTATSPLTLTGTITLPGGPVEAPVGLSMSEDGLFLYVSNSGDDTADNNYSTLEVINTAAKTVVSSDTIVNPDGEEVSYSFGNFVTGINCAGTPYTFTITINPAGGGASVDLEIAGGSQSICNGAPVTFRATAINLTSPDYNFKINGIPVQNGSLDIYTTDTIHNNDTVTCSVTGSACGGSPVTTGSNSIVMTVTSLSPPGLTSVDSIICPGDSTLVCVAAGFASYVWSTSDTTSCTEASEAGGYWVTVTGSNGCTVESEHITIEVYPEPAGIIVVNDDTLASFGAEYYQWYRNQQAIPGATFAVYIATEPGIYYVQETDTNGCTSTSPPITITGVNNVQVERVSLYPNPSTGSWQLVVGNELTGSELEVFDEEGQIIYQSKIRSPQSEIDLNVPAGVYWLRINSDNSMVVRKLVKI